MLLCRTSILTILQFFCAIGVCQNISGNWTGNSEKSPFILSPKKIVLELTLYSDSLITGVTHTYYKDEMYEHHKVSGKFHRKKNLLVFTEDSIVSYEISNGQIYESVYTMQLTTTNGKMYLNGVATEKGKRLIKTKLKTWFEKDSTSTTRDTGLISGRDTGQISQRNSSTDYDLRIPDIQKVINIGQREKDSILIEVYDNGIVDDDSVSLYLNDNVIVSNQRISEKPISFYIHLDNKQPFQKVKMIANNLGTIPPNTALMVITTKDRKYQVYLSSDLSRNAMVEFFLKE